MPAEYYTKPRLAAIQAAPAAMERIAQQTMDRRLAIAEDHTYDTGRRGLEARQRDLAALQADAMGKILAQRDLARGAAAELREYLRDNRPTVEGPDPATQAAAERLRHAQAAGADLRDLIDAAIANDDDATLRAAQVGHREYLAAQVKDGRRVAALAPALYDHIVAARLALGAMDPRERLYHTSMRSLAEGTEALERDALYHAKQAMGTRTTSDLLKQGLASDPKWAAALDGGAPGPIEAANAPVAVEA